MKNRKRDDRTMGERGVENQIKGGVKEVEGKVRGGIGDVTKNRSEQVKGRAKELEGKVQRGVGRGQSRLDRHS